MCDVEIVLTLACVVTMGYTAPLMSYINDVSLLTACPEDTGAEWHTTVNLAVGSAV